MNGDLRLRGLSTAALHAELRLRAGPRWRCLKCGHFFDGSNASDRCPRCKVYHFITGNGDYVPPNSEKQLAEWAKQYRDIIDADLCKLEQEGGADD